MVNVPVTVTKTFRFVVARDVDWNSNIAFFLLCSSSLPLVSSAMVVILELLLLCCSSVSDDTTLAIIQLTLRRAIRCLLNQLQFPELVSCVVHTGSTSVGNR